MEIMTAYGTSVETSALLGGMLGPQVSEEFGTLLSNLAKKAEAA